MTLRPCILLLCLLPSALSAAPAETQVVASAQTFFTNAISCLERIAADQPTPQTFRKIAGTHSKDLDGLYDCSLLDTNWTIQAVGKRLNFLAVGYDLTQVQALDRFRKLMTEQPGPQVSEPASGGGLQPALISMRVPIRVDGRTTGIVSMMIHTEAFLKASGLSSCRAYQIVCNSVPALSRGDLSETPHTVTLSLPGGDWILRYE